MSDDANGMVESEDGVCPRCGVSGLGVRNHWPDDCIQALREAAGAPDRRDRPSYDAILRAYFNAQRELFARHNVVAKYLGQELIDVPAETLKFWRKCREWADDPSNIIDDSGDVALYLEMEREPK